ncbi:hypothetical protein BO85DRAFT_258057 [Aspergillus piperis CBS 112811]|uniref:Zn(2)-C6 fungal-type domain-containing protein n=1 Tax=Aspergillus piperis CBS 112811 TaxID=1448313 RepID=A0A8G1R3E6_9EURO|nr:hypothetical protein BO85DRAFT_258057 [Aspergillus piperis CBS 112811]RAH58858.1 hypothetical protein BO85DRAFT_258057 [Aspergillus piperis CBS 112811]
MASEKAPRPRASRNCGNCRAVKRRCDQQIPHCGQCIRMREKCPGYRDEWELVFRDQTDKTIKRSKEKRAKRKGSTTSSRTPSPPTPGLGPSLDEIGVNYFLHNFVINNQTPSRGFFNYIPAVYNAEAEHYTLVTSMAAVGLVALANSNQQPELARHARIKYSEAIANVNTALASPVDSVKDSTLMSVISLGVFEHVSNFQSWVRHVRGAAALVVLRGKSQFTSTAATLMFNQVRADTVITCLHANQPFPEDLLALQGEASKHADAYSPFWLLGVSATKCVNLLYSVTQNKSKVSWSEKLEEAIILQEEFRRVFEIISLADPYTTIYEPTADPEVFHEGRFDVYQSTWAIRVWNNARCIRMIVSEILYSILMKVLATELPSAVRTTLEAKYQETVQIMTSLGEDMLATVPQMLGYVSLVSGQHVSYNLTSTASVPGGYSLIWTLYMVGKSPVTKRKSRKWVIRRLQDIGRGAGFAMALQLLEGVMKIDQLSEASVQRSGPYFEPTRL